MSRIPATPMTAIGVKIIHPLRENIAFGFHALPVLTRQLHDPDAFLRQRAVCAFRDHIFRHFNIGHKTFTETVKALRKLVKDEDTIVRLNLSDFLAVLASTPLGRKYFVDLGLVEENIMMLDDSEESVRKFALRALQLATLYPHASEALVNAVVVPKLLDKLQKENNDLKVPILDVLHSCSELNDDQALDNDGMVKLIPHLQSDNPSIRAKTARVIMDLSVHEKGRNIAVSSGALPPLFSLLGDASADTRAMSLAAIMMINVATPGRYTSLENDPIDKLLPLLTDPEIEIRLNCIKVLTTLAEAPSGRITLLGHLDKFYPRTRDKDSAVRRAAKKAIEVITWKP